MRLILLGMLAFATPLTPGTPFPTLEAETLAGGKLRLPDAAKGQPALLVITFSKDAGDASKPWCERFVKDFGSSRLFQAAHLERAPRLVRGLIRRGMRGDMPASLQARMLLIYQGEAEWRSRFGVTNDNLPYLVTLNAEGRITWIHQGKFDEGQYRKFQSQELMAHAI